MYFQAVNLQTQILKTYRIILYVHSQSLLFLLVGFARRWDFDIGEVSDLKYESDDSISELRL